MSYQITPADIQAAARAGACGVALDHLRTGSWTIDELCNKHPAWALWAIANMPGAAEIIGTERIVACTTVVPLEGIICARDYLTAEQLDACAAKAPGTALYLIASRLTKARLDACAAAAPTSALLYARKYLTPAREAWCHEQLHPQQKEAPLMNINTIEDFRRALASGPSFFPGGYAKVFFFHDGAPVCYHCAKAEQSLIEDAIKDQTGDWQVIACESAELHETAPVCSECEQEIR